MSESSNQINKKGVKDIIIFAGSEDELLDHFNLRCRANAYMYISPIFKYTNDERVLNSVKKDLLKKGLAGLIHAKENRYYDPNKNCVVSYYQGLPAYDFWGSNSRSIQNIQKDGD